MKKQILISTIFFCCKVLQANCQTIIPGGAVSGNWTLSGSPYLIQGAIMISNDSTLTINAGVTVNFQGHYLCLVHGRLLAIGTMQDSITFTATDTTNGWLGIRYNNTANTNDSSKFHYCKFEYGKATVASGNYDGGAFYFNHFSKVIVSNSLVTNCSADGGGGAISCYYSSPIIQNNIISYNTANAAGGAIYCNSNSSPLISNNIISHNSCGNGGGIYSYDTNGPSSPTIINNTISFNGLTGGWGGGIRCIGGSSIISQNIISNNFAIIGAGIYIGGSAGIIIFDNNISFNVSSGSGSGYGGGGIFCSGNGTISNNLISNNSSNFGGGICCYSDNSTIYNNVISNNSGQQGGAICFTSFGSDPCDSYLFNNTISNNSAQFGGALYFTSPNIISEPSIRNTILWGDSAGTGYEIYINDQGSQPNFYYCDIQGGSGAIGLNTNVFFLGTYTNNIDTNPQYVLPSSGIGVSFNALGADWSLQTNSPCINAGDPIGSYPVLDFTGNLRVFGGYIDIGAIEFQGFAAIENHNLQTNFSAFPNPFSISTTLQSNKSFKNATITIFNMYGQMIKKIKNINGKSFILHRDNLPVGMYLISLIQVDKVSTIYKLAITAD